MHEILPPDAETAPAQPGCPAPQVRVVRADEVARARAGSPYTPIVALVDGSRPHDALTAQLAGATVVLPCDSVDTPDPSALAEAVAAAATLARRSRVQAEQVGRAAHDIASTGSAVAMVARLLDHGPIDTGSVDTGSIPLRRNQLERLATDAGRLGWAAGRVDRGGGPVERVDVEAVVRAICQADLGVEVVVDPGTPRTVLADRQHLARAVAALVDNARRAGARHTQLRLSPGPEDLAPAETLEVVVVDDGCGLPPGWASAQACEPFRSGWPAPSDGLGLCGVVEFVEDCAGTFDLAPRSSGPGLAARMRLPAVPGPGVCPDDRPERHDTGSTLAEILEQIARREPLSRILENLGTAMERQLPGGRCSILLLDRERQTLHHGAGRRLPQAYRQAVDGLPIGPSVGSCGAAAATRTAVVAYDIATDPRWDDYRHKALPHGLRSCWSTPIVDDERDLVLGTFAVYHDEPWLPDAAATALVQRLTHAAAIAIRTSELHAQLVEREALFRSTFETTGLGIALVALDGRVVQANTALQTMLGSSAEGRLLTDCLHPDDAAAVRDRLTHAADSATGHSRTATLPTAEVRLLDDAAAEPVWTAMSGTLIRREEGADGYFCIGLFDLTERRRVAQARRDQAVAEAANRAKSELLALVSHELRTPLNAVIGFAQVLQSLQLTPDQRTRSVEHILGAGRHLLQIINDLLDLTGAETGQLQLAVEPVEVRRVVRDVLEMMAGLAQEKGIRLLQSGPAAPTWVLADSQRLRQVLVNLVGNAVKFSPGGSDVEIVLQQGRILVCDSGPGIPREHLGELFTPFHRIGDGVIDGTGLGLALSQRLARAMGGDIGVERTSAAGTSFWIALPAAAAPQPSPVRAEPGAAPGHAPRGRVLYLEDDAASRDLLVSALAGWPEVEVLTAGTCADAERLLGHRSADVVVLDVQLPDGSGWDFLRRLPALTGSAPRAVMLTAGVATVPAGCAPAAVLAKPVLVPALLRALRDQLDEVSGRPADPPGCGSDR